MNCKKCHAVIPDDGRFCPYCGTDQQPKKRKSRRANGTGGIQYYKGREKPYRATVTINLRRYSVGYFKTVAAANKAIAEFKPQLNAINENLTLQQVYEKVMAEKGGGISEGSLLNYEAAWKKMSTLHGCVAVSLHTSDFQTIVTKMGDDGLSKTYCNRVKSLLSQIYDWLIANQLAVVNPAKYIKIYAAPPEKKGKQTFSAEDVDKLWESHCREADITLAMIYTGMRINELFSLKPSDVHINENGHNWVVGGEKTEAGKNRTIALHRRIVPIFAGWLAEAVDGQPLLREARSRSRAAEGTWRDYWYYPMLERLGIEKLSPHKARHTFATLAAAAGGNTAAIQKQLGHTDYALTANVYTHPDIDALEKLVNLLD